MNEIMAGALAAALLLGRSFVVTYILVKWMDWDERRALEALKRERT
jgi:hypothetical protein